MSLAAARRHFTLGALAGLVLGAVATSARLLAHLPELRATWLSVPLGAGLVAVVGGLICSIVAPFMERAMRLMELPGPTTTAAPAELPDFERGARAFAWLVCVLGAGVAVTAALRVLMPLQDAEFAADLLLFLVLLVIATLPLAAAALRRFGRAAGRWLHVRGRFPWPRNDALRFGLFVALPVGGWTYSVLASHPGALGRLGWLPLALVLGLVVQVFSLLDRLPKLRGYADRRRLQVAVAGITLGLSALGSFTISKSPSAASVLESGTVTRLPLEFALAVTDVDRDGHSALFGGGDCAGFNGGVFPGSREVSGNGVDEDCDGRDSDVAGLRNSGASTFSGAWPKEQQRSYNVVWVIIDALRADHVGKKPNGVSLTPNLDRFADGSLAFQQAYSQSSSTRISFPSFLSGKLPGALDWQKRGRRYQIVPSQAIIPQLLKKEGYRTALVATKWFTEHIPSLPERFDVFSDAWLGVGYEKARRASASSTTARAIEFIEGERPAKSPFFLTLYYEGPHAPYHDHAAQGFPAAGSSQKELYASEVALVDHQLGFLLSYLQAKPKLWRDTVVVITADHGEEFGEHGGKHHSRTCYTESLHVPLWLRVPNVEGQRVEQLVSLVDIAPTLLELVGLLQGAEELDGISLLHALGSGLPAERPSFCAVFSDDEPQASLRQSVRVGDLSLLRSYNAERSLLFDRRLDAAERRELPADERLAERARLQALLDGSFSGRFLE